MESWNLCLSWYVHPSFNIWFVRFVCVCVCVQQYFMYLFSLFYSIHSMDMQCIHSTADGHLRPSGICRYKYSSTWHFLPISAIQLCTQKRSAISSQRVRVHLTLLITPKHFSQMIVLTYTLASRAGKPEFRKPLIPPWRLVLPVSFLCCGSVTLRAEQCYSTAILIRICLTPLRFSIFAWWPSGEFLFWGICSHLPVFSFRCLNVWVVDFEGPCQTYVLQIPCGRHFYQLHGITAGTEVLNFRAIQFVNGFLNG